MTKNEFMNYLEYMKNTLGDGIRVPSGTDRESLAAWYDPFKNMPLEIGKAIVREYLKHESGYFSLAKLLSYKESVCKKKMYNDKPIDHSCPLCGGTGFVQFADELNYSLCRRCTCGAGSQLPNYIKQVTQDDIANLKSFQGGPRIFQL